MEMPERFCGAALAQALEVAAPGFIVTVYGDVVVPRGEVLWMGSLIETCARSGISENLVRTAVSRLVASGRLQGERQGRRSFYRLAPAARAEFAAATRRLYDRAARPQGWMLLALDEVPDQLRRRFHMAAAGGSCWLAPDWGALPPGARVIMRVPDDAPEAMPGLADFWDLAALAARYDGFLAQFAPVGDALAQGHVPSAPDALTLRLLLVHAYRGAVLRDPFLPEALLPGNWSGSAARVLFRDLYLRLTPLAAPAIASLEDMAGHLAAETDESRSRINMLR
ncbi:PaaX family transcriptional regulator C-terminal domain-containing protein [Paracoccus sp. (in: a-proteobacteria)]|uniref:PaaX family transcriptional regulator C-terminal domain-containing protein n=1 Tax=Paracoccus sp. TaxID=267 RepID=UPI00272BD780|nr:PaaX family transcriptional regulator C-terminal domain-containing protein [Paracoccus sp. (in: a-proteobacteria)]